MGFSSTGFAYFRRNDELRTARSPRVGGDDGNGNTDNPNFGIVDRNFGGHSRYEYGNDTIQYHYIESR